MPKPSIAVIGSGFGGLAAVIELKRRGYHDIVVIEKGDDVGGVWRENTYPGAACDVPSPFYSFSFEPNPRWPKRFSEQPAILDYMRAVADKYDVRRHIRFGSEVLAARFDDATGRWTVELSDGSGPTESIEVDILVPAVGQLSRPAYPTIDGIDTFAGESFHSAQWRHDIDLTGKRVAVIGTGASAIQFVPAIQPQVASMTIFQRSAPYIIPRPDRTFSQLHHRVFERLPVTQLAERGTWYGLVEGLSIAWVYAQPLAAAIRGISRAHMVRQTRKKPGLFEKVWPDYPVGCKRILFSSNYLPALTRPNVELTNQPITKVTPTGLVTADGAEHEVDVIIYGTGFKATEFLAPISITGSGGRDLHQEWAQGAHAYYGMSVPGFPNMQIMYGPNTNTGGGSIIYFLEAQAKHLGDFVAHHEAVGAPVAVKAEVERAHDARIQERLAGSVWSQCTSWYRNADGRVTTNWPLLGVQYQREVRYDANDYEVVS
ncbi:flavin-containing monooxygenase [Nocardioides limicola]|uniref:flavin-containing monooxygenase n=1 Tax=Nocardioides limicola TaxID=2803368 RepID=UPI00193AFED2|nr:NAD(P)/FAD-dependent oxidoreductase [Nocardioides sp. DJM-14]